MWIAYYLYSQNISASTMALTQLWPYVKNAQGSIERVCEFMEMDGEKYEGDDITKNIKADIKFEDVHFSYGDKKILNGVNFNIQSGKFIAIVGGSVAGKTTILGLIERFFEPSSGSITYAGVQVDTINLNQWRSNFSYLTQEVGLFKASVRENLCYGLNYEASEEDIINATKKANIYDKIISLENGFDTEISEGGMDLSGGERQRIALARILLKRS